MMNRTHNTSFSGQTLSRVGLGAGALLALAVGGCGGADGGEDTASVGSAVVECTVGQPCRCIPGEPGCRPVTPPPAEPDAGSHDSASPPVAENMSVAINGVLTSFPTVIAEDNTIAATSPSNGLGIVLPSLAPGSYLPVYVAYQGIFYTPAASSGLVVIESSSGGALQGEFSWVQLTDPSGSNTLTLEVGTFTAKIE
jgi:hypothetical protein